jgi:predicted nucleic acid-binding protein
MGVTALDAGVLIGFLDAGDRHHDAATKALQTARDAAHRVVMPASAFAEALVGPARRGPDAVEDVRQFVHRLPIDVIPLDEATALLAAELRARHGGRLKLPHALVVATAQALDADVLVTSDRQWPSGSRLGLRAEIRRL